MSGSIQEDMQSIRAQLLRQMEESREAVRVIDTYANMYDTDRMIAELRERGLSYKRIAKVVDLSTSAVYQRAKKLGV